MKTLITVVNVAFALFVAGVLVMDTFPREVIFVVISLMLLVVPAVSAWAVHRKSSSIAMLGSNLLLLGAMCWTVSTQYASHPKEAGLLEFAILSIAVPLLNCAYFAAAGWRRGARRSAVV